MQQPATILPRYADWLTTEQVAEQVGASAVVVTSWITTGVKSESGARIRLRAVKVGGRWKVEPSAVVEFIQATTEAALPGSATARTPSALAETESVRKRRGAECMARLAAKGIVTRR